MKHLILFLVIFFNSSFIFSQTQEEKKSIYLEVIDYYMQKYSEDTLRAILLIDSTATINTNKLNSTVLLTKKYRGNGNYVSLYSDYFDLDTSNNEAIESLNHSFYEYANTVEDLNQYFEKHRKIDLVSSSIVDSILLPAKTLNIKSDFDENQIDSVIQVMNDCWKKLHARYNCVGYCTVSKPYIFENNKALIYFSFRHSPMAGMSMVLIMVKENNNWSVKKEIILGIS